VTDGYTSTAPLEARIAIHRLGRNPVSWYDFVRARIPDAPRTLDVGAGTGALWPGPRPGLTLTDASPAMCAAQRAAGFASVNARAEALPFRDGAYDAALACHVLYHLADPVAGLAELRRVLRPGGTVAVATNGTGHLAELFDVAARAGLPASRPHDAFPAEDAPRLVAEHFADVVVHRYDDVLDVPDAEPVVAYLQPLTAAQQQAVRENVTGPLTVRKHTVLITARRR
jgi:SAM-dependent methyltransferase